MYLTVEVSNGCQVTSCGARPAHRSYVTSVVLWSYT